MSPPQISIVIPTHNRLEKLVDTVAGLQRQTLPSTEYEILVMDDGSTPPVVLPVALASAHCRVIRLEGLERSAARNVGARQARGRILLFLDDDIEVKEDFLALHLQAHRQWPGALVVGAIYLPKEAVKTPFGKFRQALELQNIPVASGPTTMRNFCTAANMSLERARYFELGGFNEALRSAEDQELALRHTARGGQIVYLPKADTIHHDHSLDIRSYCRRVEWGSENVVPFCQHWPEWPANIERHKVNGGLRFGQEPLGLSLRKVMKSVLGQRPFRLGLFQWVSLLECMAPQSRLLDSGYRLLLGIHLQKGYRKGLQMYENNSPHLSGTAVRAAREGQGSLPRNQSLIKPNLFIVGAPKCGTTSMNDYLAQHPEVFMPTSKEPHYFGSDLRYTPGYIRDEAEYLSLFAAAGPGKKIIGEASTWYLFSQRAAEEIKAFSPDARIIIMLRNPVDMIYSLHGQRLYDCNEDIPDFADALEAEADRQRGLRRPQAFQGSLDVYLYREVGKYASQVQRYLEVFGRERVHFITFEELTRDTAGAFQRTCEFLDIDPTIQVDFQIKNQMKRLRWPVLGRFMRVPPTVGRWLFRSLTPLTVRRRLYDFVWNLNVRVERRQPMSPDVARRLYREFAPDIQRLSALLGRDLTAWSRPENT